MFPARPEVEQVIGRPEVPLEEIAGIFCGGEQGKGWVEDEGEDAVEVCAGRELRLEVGPGDSREAAGCAGGVAG